MDTCDDCPAHTLVRWTHPDSGDVRLCGHHSHVYTPTLVAQGFTTTDADHYALAVPAT